MNLIINIILSFLTIAFANFAIGNMIIAIINMNMEGVAGWGLVVILLVLILGIYNPFSELWNGEENLTPITEEHEVKLTEQDIQLLHFRKGYEDALKAACEYKYTYGAGEIHAQSCRVYHLKTLLREMDVSRSQNYVAGWMAQIMEQEAILAEYIKNPAWIS